MVDVAVTVRAHLYVEHVVASVVEPLLTAAGVAGVLVWDWLVVIMACIVSLVTLLLLDNIIIISN